MTLHILGGRWKGFLLQSPTTTTTRPTQSILRQAVFNICQWQIADARFLDLFAGSGAMGLEALSRGAKEATFVEQDRSALRCIRENIEKLEVTDETHLLTLDIFQSLKILAKKSACFDIIYIDPPYETGDKIVIQVLQELEKNRLLKPSSIIFVEESAQGPGLDYESKYIRKKSSRRFGVARLHQFEYIDQTATM